MGEYGGEYIAISAFCLMIFVILSLSFSGLRASFRFGKAMEKLRQALFDNKKFSTATKSLEEEIAKFSAVVEEEIMALEGYTDKEKEWFQREFKESFNSRRILWLFKNNKKIELFPHIY